MSEIKILERGVAIDPMQQAIDEELCSKRSKLEEIYNFEAQGTYVRSRASYKMEGERPTKMFCTLEKYNCVQKYVPQLFINDENNDEILVSSQAQVEKEISNFYKNLYLN